MTKLPEKIVSNNHNIAGHQMWNIGDVAKKVNQLIDYLAEREETEHYEKLPNLAPLFKADDIRYTWIDYGESWVEDALVFKTKEAAEQAREALLRLTK